MDQLDIVTVWLKTLGEPTRLRMTRALSEGSFCVGEMVRILGASQSLVSHHLRALATSGIARARKQGNLVYYSLAREDEQALPEDLREVVLKALEGSEAARSDRRRTRRVLQERSVRTREFFDRLGGDWEGLQSRFLDDKPYRAALRRMVPLSRCLVDVGCGTGVLLRELANRSRRLIGVDHSPEMLRVARESLKDLPPDSWELRLGELQHLPLSDGEAEVLIAAMVLHHMNDPERVLPEFHRALGEDGVLIVADFITHGDERLRREAADLWLGFEPDELRAWLRGAGFHGVDIQILEGTGDRLPIFLASACKRPEAA